MPSLGEYIEMTLTFIQAQAERAAGTSRRRDRVFEKLNTEVIEEIPEAEIDLVTETSNPERTRLPV